MALELRDNYLITGMAPWMNHSPSLSLSFLFYKELGVQLSIIRNIKRKNNENNFNQSNNW